MGKQKKRAEHQRREPAGTRRKGPSDDAIAGEATKLIAPILSADGLELVLVEYRRESGGRVLRVYIDKPGGITLDDCVEVTRDISDLLDVRLETIGPHRLEVSSPGADRPLTKPEDFVRFAGEKVHVRLRTPIGERKNFRGILSAATDNGITIEVDRQPMEISYTDISIARLVPGNLP